MSNESINSSSDFLCLCEQKDLYINELKETISALEGRIAYLEETIAENSDMLFSKESYD